MTDIIWQVGDPWRPLGDDLEQAGTGTVITDHGTAYLVDYSTNRYQRIPLEGGKVIFHDARWLPLELPLAVSPCGATAIGLVSWNISTGTRLVATGLHPNWPESLGDVGKQVLRAAVEHEPLPTASDHPDWVCPVPGCVSPDADKRSDRI